MAITITTTIKGLEAATAQVRGAVNLGAHNGLLIAGARGEALVKQAITSPYLSRPPAVSTGNLANSIAFQVSQEAGFSRATVFAGSPADVYAGYVESGTGPHFPPPSALLLWVKKKFNPSTEKQAMSIAWLVARKISKRGTSGFGMFARSFAQLEGELGGIFQAQIAKAIESAGVGPVGAAGTK